LNYENLKIHLGNLNFVSYINLQRTYEERKIILGIFLRFFKNRPPGIHSYNTDSAVGLSVLKIENRAYFISNSILPAHNSSLLGLLQMSHCQAEGFQTEF